MTRDSSNESTMTQIKQEKWQTNKYFTRLYAKANLYLQTT